MSKTYFDKRHHAEKLHSSVTIEALGQSEAFLDFQDRLSRVAPIDRPVILMGERGTGKELAATRLHFLSRRWQGPFVALNCAALTPTLIESELFGHEKNSFTGAGERRTGRFEAAHGGTLFLDEIGIVPMEVQEKILRVVEYGAFERVGGSFSVEVDVRIVAATNADLMALSQKGFFKRDLLDRLSFEVLFLPPLRSRPGDVMLLLDHFSNRMTFELGLQNVPGFSPEAVAALENYSWPGNIRELKNVVERAVYRSSGEPVTDIVFDPFISPYTSEKTKKIEGRKNGAKGVEIPVDLLNMPYRPAMKHLETHLLKRALKASRYNQKKAAALLGLTYDQFRGLHRKHMTALAPGE
jgi:psp operon transcriptional activator